MSKCISSHGEYSSHENDEFHTCKWCGVFDEAEVLARLEVAEAKIARVEAVVEAEKHWNEGCGWDVPAIRVLAALGLAAEQERENDE